MLISLIVAMDEERGIGQAGRVPWHLRADLQCFKALTMGHHLIVGRKTWESIGRQLPGRKMIIITRNPHYRPNGCPDCTVVTTLEMGLEVAGQAGEGEVFVGGGGEIFTLALSLADRIYLTTVYTRAGCDVFFPEFAQEEWKEVERNEQGLDDKNEFSFSYRVLEKHAR